MAYGREEEVSEEDEGRKGEEAHVEPHLVSFLRRRRELHLAISGLDDDAVLVKTGRERVRVEDLSDAFDVSCGEREEER
jgi:hypothetical protein